MTHDKNGDVISLNDTDRQQWINNDEILYNWWRRSRLSMRNFIRENKGELDRAIMAALNSKPGESYAVKMYDSLFGRTGD